VTLASGPVLVGAPNRPSRLTTSGQQQDDQRADHVVAASTPKASPDTGPSHTTQVDTIPRP
jgi:hypothetical protein